MQSSKRFKRLVIFAAIFIMAFGSLQVSAATTYKRYGKTYVYRSSAYQVYYQSELVSSASKYAMLVNGNIMIPYKKTLVKSGPKMTASYNKAKKKLTLTYNDTKVVLKAEKKTMKVNGVKVRLNTAPFFAKLNGKSNLMIPAKAVCEAFGMDYTYNKNKKAIYLTEEVQTTNSMPEDADTTLTAASFANMTTAQFLQAMGPIARADYRKTGVLASVTLAQAINESGWGKSSLTQSSNNMFGMKVSLSGNTWAGSTWDGTSSVSVVTTEEYNGKKVKITAKFRKYNTVAESVADHSAYLCNAKSGSTNRYAGLTATKSYTEQLNILKNGGYCTWSGYVAELTSLIQKYNLTQWDN